MLLTWWLSMDCHWVGRVSIELEDRRVWRHESSCLARGLFIDCSYVAILLIYCMALDGLTCLNMGSRFVGCWRCWSSCRWIVGCYLPECIMVTVPDDQLTDIVASLGAVGCCWQNSRYFDLMLVSIDYVLVICWLICSMLLLISCSCCYSLSSYYSSSSWAYCMSIDFLLY